MSNSDTRDIRVMTIGNREGWVFIPIRTLVMDSYMYMHTYRVCISTNYAPFVSEGYRSCHSGRTGKIQ